MHHVITSLLVWLKADNKMTVQCWHVSHVLSEYTQT